ncbi:MAG TPA: hypothetical protein VN495_01255 [Candidatus Paceibacterota bacterium]|nr:hypothetical protein [Candidatus Paceibacterota bacterium]
MRTLSQKWITLSQKLRAAGWPEDKTDPRKLASDYFAGRAFLSETNEEQGERSIRWYAIPGRLWVDMGLQPVGREARTD